MKTLNIIGLSIAMALQFAIAYFFMVAIGLGWVDWYIKFGFVFSIGMLVYFSVKFLDVVGWMEDEHTPMEPEKKPPLYAKIEEEDGLFYFQVYAMNHELICVSDAFATHDGAITGLWYLMDSMDKMTELSWDFR